jgi:hypothetical protein
MRTSEDVKNEIMNEIREQLDAAVWEAVICLLEEFEEKLFEEGREFERENPRVVYEE